MVNYFVIETVYVPSTKSPIGMVVRRRLSIFLD